MYLDFNELFEQKIEKFYARKLINSFKYPSQESEKMFINFK
jgi:hypothetical protein